MTVRFPRQPNTVPLDKLIKEYTASSLGLGRMIKDMFPLMKGFGLGVSVVEGKESSGDCLALGFDLRRKTVTIPPQKLSVDHSCGCGLRRFRQV